MKAFLSVFICCLLLLGGVHAAVGQTIYGGLRGTVRDANGVIPGATVKLTNTATNAVRNTVTSDIGEYVFSQVIPGTYLMDVSFQGYKTKELSDITVGTNQFHVIDVLLEVGAIAESITVTGETPIIETATASVSSSLDKTQMENLPTAGRNPFFLSITTPNVIPSGDSFFVRQQDQTNASLLSLGGGPRRANNYTLDGVPITDMRNRAVIIPSIEATEEVKVQIHTYDAEMGRTGGGVFNTLHKSGSNVFHGSALIQNRPEWATGKYYFSRNQPVPDQYYYLWAGSIGGPIVRDKTFFWASTEDYKTLLPGSSATLTLPTAAERTGDFRQSGFAVYDPLTTRPDPNNPGQFIRDQFPDNIIPANRISPVARAMLAYLPLPTSGRTAVADGYLDDFTKQITGNVQHRFSDRMSLSGTYMWYDSAEPTLRFYRDLGIESAGDPDNGRLYRTVNVLALNASYLPTDTSVVALRYGYTSFQDDCVATDFDPGTLGFSQNFLNLIDQNDLQRKFPRINTPGYATGTALLGDRNPTDITWWSHNVNGTYSKYVGSHTIKFGADYRKIGVDSFLPGQTSGVFNFTTAFTQGPNPNSPASRTGDTFASFLLGYPQTGSMTIASPSNVYINYYGGFVQDDWRVGNLVLNFGLRYEFEQGLQEQDDQFTVGFDRDRAWPVQPVPGMTIRGGLMYAGVDGYATHQSNPSSKKFSPRVGFAYSLNDETVIRGGYGLFWAPHQYTGPSENTFGTRGFTAITDFFSGPNPLVPSATLTDPFPTTFFPNGLQQPVGSAGGLTTGAGGRIDFVDQLRESAYVHQWSIDVQRELGRRMSFSVGYVGARGENLGIGGTADGAVNLNQLDPQYLSLGTQLQQQVANPFFGIPIFGAFSRSATITRGQLLRPYPQFGDIIARQVSQGRSMYHSAVLQWEKRMSDGWSARVNYVYSQAKDNLLETNFFTETVGQTPTTNSANGLALNAYDLDSEYALSLLDAPHRLNITGIVELPFGNGKRWATSGTAAAIAGGWTISATGSYQSGFPVNIWQNNNNSGLFGSGQRPNSVSGADPASSGSTTDRLTQWFNPAAWTAASAFTFGNAPRSDDRARTPVRHFWDIAFQKSIGIAGGKALQLRAELINAFDHPDFRGPRTALGLANFGVVDRVRGFPRMWQFMARFTF